MPISFAGVPLSSSPADAEAAFRWWHGHRLDLYEYVGYGVSQFSHLPTPQFPVREAPRIGVLNWPTAVDRFATCFLTATGEELTAIRTALGTVPAARPLVFSDGYGNQISPDMYLTGVHPIAHRNNGRDLFLLVLSDVRYFWWQSGAAASPETAASWASLFSQLFSLLSASAAVGTVPAAYLTPNMSRWSVGVVPVPPLIQAVAVTIGLRTIRKLDGTVAVQTYQQASDADDARWQAFRYECLAGGRISGADIARGMPEAVDTYFFDGTSQTTTLASLSLSWAQGVAGVAGRKGRVTADPSAPTAGQKTAYAAQAALDYYNWGYSRTDAAFRGICAIDPVGLDEAVEWSVSQAGMLTRVFRSPWADRNIYGDRSEVGASGSGQAPEYQDDCVDGYLQRRRAVLTVTADGVSQTEYTFERDLGIPCQPAVISGSGGSGASGSGGRSGLYSPVVFDALSRVCPTPGNCVVVTSNYTVLVDDWLIEVAASGGPVTITLPPWESGLFFKIVKTDTSGHGVTIAANGTETINGASTFVLTTQWDGVTVEARCSAGWVVFEGRNSGSGGS